jgi:hypothetical protein
VAGGGGLRAHVEQELVVVGPPGYPQTEIFRVASL